MSRIEPIMQELKLQKQIIEEKGGTITVLNDYPSPSEITEAIRTIETPDFTIATATEEDVVFGKTFYSNSSQLKTGTGQFQAGLMNHLFMVDYNKQTTDETLYYSCPAGLSSLRRYCFYCNYNPIHITFNPELTKVEEYAFYYAQNAMFDGFDNHTKLQTIEKYAFSNCSLIGMNAAALPNCVKTLQSHVFYNSYNAEYTEFILPSSLTSIASSIYRQLSRKTARSLDLTNCTLKTLADNMFAYLAFDCDLNLPEGFTQVAANCFYGGCFHNIYFPSSMTSVAAGSFSALTNNPLSNFYLKTVTFAGENPPSIGSSVFAEQHKQNGFKIYVPDNAIDEYKAVSNLSSLVNYIYPISQKD